MDALATVETGRSFRHRFEGPFFRRLFVGGVRSIPESLQRATMPFWASIFYALVPRARRTVEANHRQVLGDLPTWTRHRRSFDLFVNYAQSLTNMYRLHMGLPIDLEATLVDRHHLDAVRGQGRGMVTITGHLGAWQVMPYLIRNRADVPPMTIAMAEEPNRRVSEWERKYRESLDIVYTTTSPFALLELAKVLRQGRIVGMQLDRSPGGPHVMVPFCGKPAPFPTGPAMLARTTGCPIVPLFAVFSDKTRRRVEIHYEEHIEVPRTRDRDADLFEGTRRAVEVYERYVRRYPEQWFNFHDFWAAPPPAP